VLLQEKSAFSMQHTTAIIIYSAIKL